VVLHLPCPPSIVPRWLTPFPQHLSPCSVNMTAPVCQCCKSHEDAIVAQRGHHSGLSLHQCPLPNECVRHSFCFHRRRAPCTRHHLVRSVRPEPRRPPQRGNSQSAALSASVVGSNCTLASSDLGGLADGAHLEALASLPTHLPGAASVLHRASAGWCFRIPRREQTCFCMFEGPQNQKAPTAPGLADPRGQDLPLCRCAPAAVPVHVGLDLGRSIRR
jgi:hypothetical protein